MNPKTKTRAQIEMQEAQEEYHKRTCQQFGFDADASTSGETTYSCPHGFTIEVLEDSCCGGG